MTIRPKTTFDRVAEIVASQLGLSTEDVKADSTFADLSGDPLDVLEMVMDVEDEFDIQVDDTDIVVDTTIQSVVDLVDKMTGAASRSAVKVASQAG